MSATPIAVPVQVFWTVTASGQSATVTPATPLQVAVAQVHLGLRGGQGVQGLKGDQGDTGDVTPQALAARDIAVAAAAAAANTAADQVAAHSQSLLQGSGAALGVQPPGLLAERRTLESKIGDLQSTPMDFDATGDGVADDTVAVQRWAASGKKLKGWGGRTYAVSATITLEPNTNLVSAGPHEGLVALAGFVGSYVLANTPGSLIEIGAPNAATVVGGYLLSFAAAPAAAAGDELCIYDSRDGSYLADRPYYRAGEWLQVAKVDGNTLVLPSGLYGAYTPDAAIKLYKFLPDRSSFEGVFSVGGVPTYGRVRLSLLSGAGIGLVSTNAWDSCLSLDRCTDVRISGRSRIRNAGNGGNDYGIVIGNSGRIDIEEGARVYGRRHAVTTGGSNVLCCVPCQDVTVRGATLNNDPLSLVAAADFHGNTRSSHYIGCKSTGANLSGQNTSFVDGVLYGTHQGWFGYVSELRGGTVRFARNRCIGTVNPAALSRGLFDVQGTDNVVDAVTVVVEDNVIEQTDSSTATELVLVRNVGKAVAYSAKVTGNRLKAPSRLACALDLGATAGGTVHADSRVEIDRNDGLGVGCALMAVDATAIRYHGTAKLRLQAQQKVLDVVSDGAALEFTSAQWTFDYGYPRQPTMQVTISPPNTIAIAAEIPAAQPTAYAQRATSLGAWGGVRTATALPNGTSLRLNLQAVVAEF